MKPAKRIPPNKHGLMALAGAWKDIPLDEIAQMKRCIEEGRKSKRLDEAIERP